VSGRLRARPSARGVARPTYTMWTRTSRRRRGCGVAARPRALGEALPAKAAPATRSPSTTAISRCRRRATPTAGPSRKREAEERSSSRVTPHAKKGWGWGRCLEMMPPNGAGPGPESGGPSQPQGLGVGVGVAFPPGGPSSLWLWARGASLAPGRPPLLFVCSSAHTRGAGAERRPACTAWS
jgi:hypothetical protein